MFQLWPVISFIPLVVKGHTVSHWKALGGDKYEPRGLMWVRTSRNVTINYINRAFLIVAVCSVIILRSLVSKYF